MHRLTGLGRLLASVSLLRLLCDGNRKEVSCAAMLIVTESTDVAQNAWCTGGYIWTGRQCDTLLAISLRQTLNERKTTILMLYNDF